MIEFKMKPLYQDHKLDDWAEIGDPRSRMPIDFRFEYADYRIMGTVFQENSKAFREALRKEKCWMKLHD